MKMKFYHVSKYEDSNSLRCLPLYPLQMKKKYASDYYGNQVLRVKYLEERYIIYSDVYNKKRTLQLMTHLSMFHVMWCNIHILITAWHKLIKNYPYCAC